MNGIGVRDRSSCIRCGLSYDPAAADVPGAGPPPDPCLGLLADVAQACCGHGVQRPFVVFGPGARPGDSGTSPALTTLTGVAALAWFAERGVGPDILDARTAAVRSCRVCGCTDDRACPGGCSWVESDLCSACAVAAANARARRGLCTACGKPHRSKARMCRSCGRRSRDRDLPIEPGRDPLGYACPSCEAPAGEFCETRSGRRPTELHAPRLALAGALNDLIPPERSEGGTLSTLATPRSCQGNLAHRDDSPALCELSASASLVDGAVEKSVDSELEREAEGSDTVGRQAVRKVPQRRYLSGPRGDARGREQQGREGADRS